jgi:hypothetical protein
MAKLNFTLTSPAGPLRFSARKAAQIVQRLVQRVPIGIAGLGALALIGAALVLRLVLIQNWPPLNSDEATFGLMARHIAYQGKLPIYMYGQNYMGALEAYVGAASFHIFGPSTATLRLGLVLLFALFLWCLYLLATRLWGRGVALLSLAVFAAGTKEIFERQLPVLGGSVDTLVFGTLAVLLATQLALSGGRARANAPGRVALWGTWGLDAGLGLWSHVLVLPWLLFSFALLVAFCRREIRTRAMAALIAGLILGLSPVIAHDISAGQSSITTVFSTYRATGAGASLAHATVGRQVAATILVSLPLATGAGPLCSLSPQDAWPLSDRSSSHTVACTVVHGLWSAGITGLWGLALVLTLLPLFRLWRRRQAVNECEGREDLIRRCARLAVLAGAGATVVAYVLSPSPAIDPRGASRYLVGGGIAVPALLALLVRPPHIASSWWRGVVRATSYGCLTLLFVLMVSGVQQVMGAERDYASWLDWRQHAQVDDLLQRGVTRVYTDYWSCDRIAFQSNEQIICAVLDDHLRPGQDRYLPYRAQVRAASNASYLFPDTSPQASALIRSLRKNRTRYRRSEAYGYVIYQPIPAP